MKSLLFLSSLLAAFLSLSAASAGGTRRGLYGAVWQPIKNVSNPHVWDVAKFAVAEHNKNSGTPLWLRKVDSGELQIAAGVNYRLILAVAVGFIEGVSAEYEATVWEKNWNEFELTSFKWIRF